MNASGIPVAHSFAEEAEDSAEVAGALIRERWGAMRDVGDGERRVEDAGNSEGGGGAI